MKSQRLVPLQWLLLAVSLGVLATIAGPAPVLRASTPAAAHGTVRLRVEGCISAMNGAIWTIAGQYEATKVVVDANTALVLVPPATTAQLNDWVIVTATYIGNSNLHADVITVTVPASSPAPTIQISGRLVSKDPSGWVVGATVFVVTAQTTFSPSGSQPPVGALVSVVLAQRVDPATNTTTYSAVSVENLASSPQAVPLEFSGTVTDINNAGPVNKNWIIDNTYRVYWDKTTIFDNGEVQKWDRVDIKASVTTDGTLLANRVRVNRGPASQSFGGLVQGINKLPDGRQDWIVLAFPAGTGANPTLVTVHLASPAVVDQSRAPAGKGRWVDVTAVSVGPDEYRADSARTSRPVPVKVTGPVRVGSASGSGGRWLDVSGHHVWLADTTAANNEMQAQSLPAGEGGVIVDGLLLGNGVIVAQQLSAQAGVAPAAANTEGSAR